MKIKTFALILALTLIFGCAVGCSDKQTFTVTFDYQDAVIDENSEFNERQTVTAFSGSAVTLPQPENAPYTFGGWYTAPGGGGEKTDSLTANKDITLYAYWLGSEGLSYEGGKVRRGTLSIDAETLVVAPAHAGTVTTEVAYDAFSGMSKLSRAVLPATVTRLGDNAFRFCAALSDFTVPPYLKHVGSNCFNGNDALTSIVLPATCEYVGYEAFAACNALAYVQFRGETVPKTPVDLSFGHSVILVVPDASLENFEKAYSGLSNTNHIMPLSAKSENGFIAINGKAIRYIGADENVTIPDGITAIQENCFYGNPSVKEITVPAAVTRIEQYAFANLGAQLTLRVAYPQGGLPNGYDALFNNDLKDTKYNTVYKEAGI